MVINLNSIIDKMTREVKNRCAERVKKATNKIITDDKPLYECSITSMMKQRRGL